MTEDLGPSKTFFAYMAAVMASDLTPSQRLILIVQAKHADACDGELTNSYPSEDTLARETGLSKDTIQRARKVLVEKGWLIQTHSGRGGSSKKSNEYDLAVPDSKPHGAALQSRMVPSQSRMVPHLVSRADLAMPLPDSGLPPPSGAARESRACGTVALGRPGRSVPVTS